MGSGVFVSIKLQFPRGGLERWKKQRLTGEPLNLADNIERLWDQLGSELMDTELGPPARISSLLALIRKAYAEGNLFAVVECKPGKGVFKLSGYLDGFDEFSVWFEPLARLCATASAHEGTGMAAFVADTELVDEIVFYWFSVSPNQVTLSNFGDKGSPDPTDEQKAALPDSELQRIAEAYSTWVAGAGQKCWLKRTAGKVGFIAPDGHWLIEPVLDDAGVLSHDRVAFRREWLWGYLDTHGTEVVSPRFHSAADFQGGLARVQSNENHLYGFIADDGSWVIEPVFIKADHMFDGLALVENEQFRGYVDSQGKRAIEIDFAHAYSFASGRALVCHDISGPIGFIDTSGEVVIPLNLEAAGHFCQGYAPAMKNGKWGHLDRAGNWAVRPIYQRVDYFFDGFAMVMKDGHWGVVDTQGKVVALPRFTAIEFSGEFFKVKEGKMHGLLNRNGEPVVEPRYSGMGGVAENLIPVKEAEEALWGYIDAHGQWAIEPRYAAAHDFGNGHALIKAADSQPEIINTDGMITATLNVELDEAGPFAASGVAWICLGGKYGLVRVDGRVLLDPDLEEVNGTGADWIRVKYPSR